MVMSSEKVQSSLRDESFFSLHNPAMNRWAIFNCPSRGKEIIAGLSLRPLPPSNSQLDLGELTLVNTEKMRGTRRRSAPTPTGGRSDLAK